MIRAIIQNGEIRPIDPLPPDWRDGREVIVEEAERASTDDLDEWFRALQLLGPAQYDPGEREQVQMLLNEADEQARALVRLEMGLGEMARHCGRDDRIDHENDEIHEKKAEQLRRMGWVKWPI